MRVLYLDTFSGIAGDMTLAALVDCGAEAADIARCIESLGLGAVRLEFTPTMRHGFRALRLDIHHPPEHAHRHLSDIEELLDRGELSPRARNMARRIFGKVAQAEAHVHGTTVEHVHFHEVGAVDSIVDIVGVAVAIDLLNIGRVVAAPPVTGSGMIRIAHGWVSVPAPATVEILRGIPVRGSPIEAELTTPTGAAIVAALADDIGPLPSMRIERTGYGAGHKELPEQANVLRAVVGDIDTTGQDVVWLLETNLDDVTGEHLGYAMGQLMQAGALD
ncbi:MAG: nickel pincer cofactor biosynthesis protein LarC, partial [Planctomycetota bacterium]